MNQNTQKTLNDFENWLNQFLNFEKNPQKNIFWLDTMKFLCEKFSNPQDSYKKIHVAGSKGKGTVSCLISSIIAEYGKKTGLYTSPHLLDFFERAGTNSGKFDDKIYLDAISEIKMHLDFFDKENLPLNRGATWFELVTLFAFLTFRQAKCEWAVLETGLGGRLDATNVVIPEASVIMPIELEHTEYLGDTIEKIAYEKAGIIKNKIPVIISAQKPEARNVFEKVALEKNAPVYFFDDFVKKYEYSIINEKSHVKIYFNDNFSNIFSRPLEFNLNFLGEIQAMNSAVAAFAVKTVMPEVSDDIIEKGLENAKLSGRFEIVKDKKSGIKYVLDGAHTVNSLKITIDTFKRIFPESRTILFACAADKKMDEMSKIILENGFENIILTRPGEKKQSDLPQLQKDFENDLKENTIYSKENIFIEADSKTAFYLAIAKAAESKQNLLICGSFYLVAEIKSLNTSVCN